MEICKVKSTAGKDKTPVINELAPKWPFRMIVVGSSGSGKTNMVLDLIQKYIPWQVLIVYARHMGPAYEALRRKVEAKERRLKRPISFWSDTLEDAIPVDELSPENRNLVIFDDFVLDRKHQDVISDYFVRGRHRNCSCIYISQSYYDIPKIIRTNSSHVAIFKGYNGHDLVGLWKDHGAGMKRGDFERYLREATRRPYGFAFIDNSPARAELRWRIGFDTLVLPDDENDGK